MEISWQQFGLKANPYDKNPLVEGGGLPLKEAFVGRKKERRAIENHVRSSENICLAVTGDAGVGKTSLINYEKYIWKHSKEQTQLFSARHEIEASDRLLNKEDFLMEIIGSILRELRLLQPDLLKDPLLIKLEQTVDIRQQTDISTGVSFGMHGLTGGVDVTKGKTHTPRVHLAMSMLEQSFLDLLEFVKQHDIRGRRYQGIIVHVNNFDVVLLQKGAEQKVRTFFNEIRNVLQTPDMYFMFLGPPALFTECIARDRRVKSVFVRTPVLVCPLSKSEVAEAFKTRMRLLVSDGVQDYVQPVADQVIFRLHDLYEGDIRSIMSAITDILHKYADTYADRVLQTLSVDEALVLLGEERWESIRDSITKTERNIVQHFIRSRKHMSGSEMAVAAKKQASNVTTYFRKLKELGVIEEKEQQGRIIRYGLTTEFEPLRWWAGAHDAIASGVSDTLQKQKSLFT